MAERDIRVVGPSYWLADRKTAVQRTVNMFPKRVEGVGEDAPAVLEPVPGLDEVIDLGATIRGLHNADGRLFAAAGSTLYEITTSDTSIDRGVLALSTGRVEMANGNDQVALVDGLNLQVFNTLTDTLTTVTSDGWRGSYRVEYIDGYFVFVDPDTDQFYISAIDDASTLDALDFSSADSQPDNIVAHIVRHRETYFFGTRSCEVWINNGAEAFPLARYQGTPIDVGCVGKYAVCRAADTLIWVGQTDRGGPYVYKMDGYQPVRISTEAVEQQLASSTDYTSATCWSYQEAGAEFVCIDAPGLSTTWCWDAATGMWTERAELDGGDWTPSRVTHHAWFNGAHYVAGGTKLYRMSRDYHTLAGDALVQERTFPHLLQPSLEPISYHSLELRCTTGDTSSGSVTLEISNDGGSVFGPPLQRSLGATGQRTRRVRWLGLGTCPAGGSRVFRVRMSDNVPFTISGAALG